MEGRFRIGPGALGAMAGIDKYKIHAVSKRPGIESARVTADLRDPLLLRGIVEATAADERVPPGRIETQVNGPHRRIRADSCQLQRSRPIVGAELEDTTRLTEKGDAGQIIKFQRRDGPIGELHIHGNDQVRSRRVEVEELTGGTAWALTHPSVVHVEPLTGKGEAAPGSDKIRGHMPPEGGYGAAKPSGLSFH